MQRKTYGPLGDNPEATQATETAQQERLLHHHRRATPANVSRPPIEGTIAGLGKLAGVAPAMMVQNRLVLRCRRALRPGCLAVVPMCSVAVIPA